jgi:hypothetical protein
MHLLKNVFVKIQCCLFNTAVTDSKITRSLAVNINSTYVRDGSDNFICLSIFYGDDGMLYVITIINTFIAITFFIINKIHCLFSFLFLACCCV